MAFDNSYVCFGFGGNPIVFLFCGNKNHLAPKIMVEDLAIFNDLDKYMKLPLDIMKKIFRILMIVLFPIGIVYCIGKNLFSGNFPSFLGGLFLALIGFCLAIYFFRPDLVQQFLNIFR